MNSVGGYQQKAGAVSCGGTQKAAPAQFQVGGVGFGPQWSAEDSMAASIVRLEREADELRAEVALLKHLVTLLAGERDNWRAAANQAVADRDRNKSMADELAERLAQEGRK